MALAPLSLRDPASRFTDLATLPPSDRPLRLLLEPTWQEPSFSWVGIAGLSLLIHALAFFVSIHLPSFGQRREPLLRLSEHHTPLYLPPDVITQKTPNRVKPSKQVDLAALLSEQRTQRARQASPGPSYKHFELPRQSAPPDLAKNKPKILPEAPNVALSQTPVPTSGIAAGLPAAAPPLPQNQSPFQNIGSEAPPNPHPKIAPPKATVQEALNALSHGAGQHAAISDESLTQPSPATPGLPGQLGAQHAAIELQSDPQGADFKPYLTRILAIVRANWRQVIPESVRMGTLRGRTVVEFIINRDGSIPKLVTAESSGLDPLDRAAVAGLSMSNPLPPLPADFKGFQIRLAFSFAYNMPVQ